MHWDNPIITPTALDARFRTSSCSDSAFCCSNTPFGLLLPSVKGISTTLPSTLKCKIDYFHMQNISQGVIVAGNNVIF